MSNATPTGKYFRIFGFDIPEYTFEPCTRLHELMQEKAPTCTCSDCERREVRGAADLERFRQKYLSKY